MFTTLVESRAVRARSTRGAVVSVLLHGTLIAAAVALTTGVVDARPESHTEKPPVWIPMPHTPPQPVPEAPRTPQPQAPTPTAPTLTIIAPTDIPNTIPPIDINTPPMPPDQIPRIGSGLPHSPFGSTNEDGALRSGSVVSENMVDRAPRIIGNAPSPRYPNALRESGVDGHVVIRFVVDTVGRAELDNVTIVEATHQLFADAVKNALGQYRFSPGAIGTRKVRTLVQVPFTFTLRP
ncbi:MAG: TonB family protein [bacterium]